MLKSYLIKVSSLYDSENVKQSVSKLRASQQMMFRSRPLVLTESPQCSGSAAQQKQQRNMTQPSNPGILKEHVGTGVHTAGRSKRANKSVNVGLLRVLASVPLCRGCTGDRPGRTKGSLTGGTGRRINLINLGEGQETVFRGIISSLDRRIGNGVNYTGMKSSVFTLYSGFNSSL